MATPSGQAAQCVFDGYVLVLEAAPGPQLTVAPPSRSAAQDASWLMNIDETVPEWAGQTDGQVANAIFGELRVHARRCNTVDDSPAHDPDGHTFCSGPPTCSSCAAWPAAQRQAPAASPAPTPPGQRTGFFVDPPDRRAPVATISLVDPAAWDVDTLDFDWDVMRPTEVEASQVDPSTDSGVRRRPRPTPTPAGWPLDRRGTCRPQRYSGHRHRCCSPPPADSPSFRSGPPPLLREAGWFARCDG